MEVGVITFHNAHNYGATLQTWALQKKLKELGTNPCVIHYHPDVIDKIYLPLKLDSFEKTKNYLMKKDYRRLLHVQKVKYYKYQTFIRENLRLVGNFSNDTQISSYNFELDAFITGSDQIWNSDHTNGDPAYLLDFVKDNKKKISYGASIGKDMILPQYQESFRRCLSGFDAISVREKSAVPVIESLIGKKIQTVLDPTLLLDRENYEEIKVHSKRTEPYILVYMMEDNKMLIKFANLLSIAMGLPIIQRKPIKIFRNELENYFTHTPGEFLGEIENAEFILTNSFHGTVFSIIYEKPFLSMLHSDTGSRTVDLLESLGLESHILYNPQDFHDVEQMEIKDKEGLALRIQQLREESVGYLVKSLDLPLPQ